jgi:hypothetical protein
MAKSILYQWSIIVKLRKISERYDQKSSRPISINIKGTSLSTLTYNPAFDINVSKITTATDEDYDY